MIPAYPAKLSHYLISRLGRERKEISCGQESEAENSGTQVEIMSGAVLQSPTHYGKQMKCLADMRKNDDNQKSSAEQLQIPAHRRERGGVAGVVARDATPRYFVAELRRFEPSSGPIDPEVLRRMVE